MDQYIQMEIALHGALHMMLSFGWAESVADGSGPGQSHATILILVISILQAVKMFVRHLARRNEDNLLGEGGTEDVGWRQPAGQVATVDNFIFSGITKVHQTMTPVHTALYPNNHNLFTIQLHNGC